MKNLNKKFTNKFIGFICKKWLLIKHYLREEKRLNKLVAKEISEVNIQRIKILQVTAIVINVVLIFSFTYLFNPVTVMEEKWRNSVIIVHLVSVAVVALISLLLIINRKKANPLLGARIIEHLIIVYVVSFGLAIIFVDLPRTTNIVPFLIVCVVISAFVLRRPVCVVTQYLISYLIFFNIISTNETDSMALITNCVNGSVFVIIGIFIGIILWQTERNNLLQKRKILEQQNKLESMAYYDDLTGLINRRKWIELLNQEFERMKRYNHKSSILLLDIDNFKAINDQFGHPAGDRILQEIALRVKKQLRSCDRIGRWGGEEFIVLLVETPLEKGLDVGEKLRNEIENLTVSFESHRIMVTLSIGVSSLDCEKEFFTSYKEADQALYLAKQNGRNRVECYPQDTLIPVT